MPEQALQKVNGPFKAETNYHIMQCDFMGTGNLKIPSYSPAGGQHQEGHNRLLQLFGWSAHKADYQLPETLTFKKVLTFNLPGSG